MSKDVEGSKELPLSYHCYRYRGEFASNKQPSHGITIGCLVQYSAGALLTEKCIFPFPDSVRMANQQQLGIGLA
jgi:hypothetical protein